MKQIYRAGVIMMVLALALVLFTGCGSDSTTSSSTATNSTTQKTVTIDDVKAASCLGHSGSYAAVLEKAASKNPDMGYSYTWSIGFTGPGAPDESKIFGDYTPVTLKWNGMPDGGVSYLYFDYDNNSKNLTLRDIANPSGSVINENADKGTWENLLIDTLYAMYG